MRQYWEKRSRGLPDLPIAYYFMRRNDTKYNFVDLHWHSESEIIFSVEGEAELRVEQKTFTVKKGDIYFVNPEELHSISPINVPCIYHAFVFSNSIFEFPQNHFFEKEFTLPLTRGDLCYPRCLQKTDCTYKTVAEHLNNIAILYDNFENSKPLIFANLSEIMLGLMYNDKMQKIQSTARRKPTMDIKKCIEYMENNYSKKITLAELSELIHTVPNYFCSYFKNCIGCTPFVQLNIIRIEKAAEKLRKTDMPVIDIALSCGFENISYFIKRFKGIMGTTPKAYRIRFRE